MVTMADVARVAGVNASTVSHVLNGTRTVSEETKERVLGAIAQTGYRRNALARSLATSSTMTLGLAISSVVNPYFGDLIRAVEAAARAAGYIVMLSDTYDDATVERYVVERLIERRVDGLLLTPAAGSMSETLPFLKASGVPAVLMDRCADVDLDQIASENLVATAQLTDHLADLGHRRIAMVSGLTGLDSTTERLRGFRDVVARRGLDDDPALVLDGASSAGGAERSVTDLFATHPRPTAVVVGNNAMTIGTLRALRTMGLTVPGDVAMVCYDDFDWADLFEPRLTAMDQRVPDIGKQAVDLMIDRIADPSRPTRRIRLTPTLQHRSSCGCS